MSRRYFGKTTAENVKHPMWTDGEKHLTAIHWKKWARENGYVGELFDKKFIIYNTTTNRIVKTLVRS